MNISIIGCGNLGESIVSGILQSKISAIKITATRNDLTKLDYLKKQGVTVISDNKKAVKNSDIVIICVKPYKVKSIFDEIKNTLKSDTIIGCTATGIHLDDMIDMTNLNTSIFRIMPNTAAKIGQSLTTISYKNASKKEIKNIKEIFDCVGKTIFIEESKMEAVTVLGSSGTAFAMRYIRANAQVGVQMGLDLKTTNFIINQTVKGAAMLLQENNSNPESEIDKITTPGGCTIEGLNEMEYEGFSSSIIKGLMTSFDKLNY